MKILLSICVILVSIGISDLNPLLLWEPYRVCINEFANSSPKLFLSIFLSALFVGVWIAIALDPKQTVL